MELLLTRTSNNQSTERMRFMASGMREGKTSATLVQPVLLQQFHHLAADRQRYRDKRQRSREYLLPIEPSRAGLPTNPA